MLQIRKRYRPARLDSGGGPVGLRRSEVRLKSPSHSFNKSAPNAFRSQDSISTSHDRALLRAIVWDCASWPLRARIDALGRVGMSQALKQAHLASRSTGRLFVGTGPFKRLSSGRLSSFRILEDAAAFVRSGWCCSVGCARFRGHRASWRVPSPRPASLTERACLGRAARSQRGEPRSSVVTFRLPSAGISANGIDISKKIIMGSQ